MTLNVRKMSLFLAVLCSTFFLSACSNDFVIESRNEGSCKTPDNLDGNCLLIEKCQYVFNIIKTKGISHPAALKYVRQSTCGFEGINPKVCCPGEAKDAADDRHGFEGKNDKFQETSKEKDDGANESFQNPQQLLPSKCGEDYSNRIIGGEITELDEFPWMAVLEYEAGQNTITACGGTLINKRYVLTAAHCIRSIPSTWRLRNVRLGENNMRTDPDCMDEGNGEYTCADPVLMVPIERVIVHEDYMSPERYRNDIALLRLDRDVQMTRYIQPICLPSSNDVSSLYWSAGWGQIENKPSSNIKLKVRLPYINFNSCRNTYYQRGIILGDGQMCAGGQNGKDTCKGDSGGPLMKQVQNTGRVNKWVIDGVVSFGHSPCGLLGWPAVYTKVYHYIPWILSKLRP